MFVRAAGASRRNLALSRGINLLVDTPPEVQRASGQAWCQESEAAWV